MILLVPRVSTSRPMVPDRYKFVPGGTLRRGVLTLAIAVASVTGPSEAQTVQGTVVDHSTREAVPDATVILLNDAGIVRSMALADALGRFSIDAPTPGRYSLRVDAAGYNTLNGATFLAGAGRSIEFVLEVWSLTELEPVVVTAEEEPFAPGPLAGFYERLAGGRGQYLTRADIEQKGATRFTDVLRLEPGVSIVPLSGSSSYTIRLKGVARLQGNCPPELYVDNARWGAIDAADGPDRSLFPSDIEGIEVYSPSSVPAEFASGNSMCGVVVVWTKRGP